MKKLLVMLAIAGTVVACNNSSEGTTGTGDSLNKDSNNTMMSTPDSNNMMNSAGDSNMHKSDSITMKSGSDTNKTK
jgi:hypothetical protein